MRLEHSLVVERPRADVFAFLADPKRLRLWQSGLVEVQARGEPGLGARHLEVRSLMGKRIEQTLEVTVFDPPERLAFEVVEGPLALRVSHELTDVEDGTRIHVVGEGDPGPLFRFASPIVARLVESQSKGDFARLKQLLEEGG
jgi:carbon monoxide dehydrogenase subunit G